MPGPTCRPLCEAASSSTCKQRLSVRRQAQTQSAQVQHLTAFGRLALQGSLLWKLVLSHLNQSPRNDPDRIMIDRDGLVRKSCSHFASLLVFLFQIASHPHDIRGFWLNGTAPSEENAAARLPGQSGSRLSRSPPAASRH